MTASKQAKAAGLKSLAQLSEMCGVKPNGQPVVSPTTLHNWHKNKPKLFALLVSGASNEAAIRTIKN